MRMLITSACLAVGLGDAAMASDICAVPMARWQPREALQAKLEHEGWQVRSIKTDDGCYEANAINAEGSKVEAYFDPQTFQPINTKLAE